MKNLNGMTPHKPQHSRSQQNSREQRTAFSAKKLAAVFAAAILCLYFASCQKGNPKLKTKTLSIAAANGATVTLVAEIADTPQTREKGYMFRKNIPDGTGMLFIFENDRVLNFWMKNTPTPLSIAYIDYKGVIKDIFDMKPFDLKDITAPGYVRYALEVPQGWFERAGIKVGDKLNLDF